MSLITNSFETLENLGIQKSWISESLEAMTHLPTPPKPNLNLDPKGG